MVQRGYTALYASAEPIGARVMRIRGRFLSATVATCVAAALLPGPVAAGAATAYVESVSFSDPAHGIVTGGFGNQSGFISLTSDGGRNWRAVRVDPDTWYRGSGLGEGSGAGVVARLYGGEAIVTGDYGTTWTTRTVLAYGGGFEARGADMEGGSAGWVVGRNGNYALICSTADGGASWTRAYEGPKYPPLSPELDPPVTDAAMRAVDGADANAAWAVGLEWNAGSYPRTIKRSLIQKTTDGGSTWTTQGVTGDPLVNQTSRDVYAVSAVDSRTAFAVAGIRDMLYQTIDGSAWTWKYLGSSNSQILYDISMVSTSTGWAVGSAGRIFKTTDGWVSRVQQPTGVFVAMRSVHAMDAMTAWAVGDNETILYTLDGGTTWLGCRGATPPSARITAPAASGVVTGTTLSIEGTATDGVGVGAGSVDVRVRRSDGKYFNGSGWQSTEAWLRASTPDWWDHWSYVWPLDPGQNRTHTYSFAWKATDIVESAATSTDVVTGISVDNEGPSLLVAYHIDSTRVLARFSEPLMTGSAKASSFALDGGLSVVSASVVTTAPTDVIVSTTAQTPGQTYVLTAGSGAASDPYGNASLAGGDDFTAASGPTPFLTVSQGAGPGRPTAPFFSAPGRTVVVDQLILGSQIGTTTVGTVTVEATGSAIASFPTDVAMVSIVRDNDSDGALSAGDTTASARAPSGTSVPLGGIGSVIPANTTRSLLVVYTLSGSAGDGRSIGSKVTSVGVEAPAGVDPFQPILSAGSGHTVRIDGVAPAVAVSWPTAGVTISGSSVAVTGTASDTGSGLDAMRARILRDDGVYWDGFGWSASPTVVPVAESSVWSYPWVLDPEQSGERSYAIGVLAQDGVGHSTWATVTPVRVDNTAPVALSATSPGLTQVDVLFSERLATSTVLPGSFSASDLTVTGAVLQPSGTTVRLTVAGGIAAQRYRFRSPGGAVSDVAGNGCVPVEVSCVLPGTAREAGPSRYDTAIEISKATFGSDSCTNAVLATGQSFADALASSGLAGAVGGPLLLTRGDALPTGVTGEFARLGVTKVWIAGGTGAVSSEVESALAGLGYEVVRVAGGTRYGTAAAIATKVAEIKGASFARRAFVVRGDGFADALAVSPAAAANGFPVLLTRTGALPAETAGAITSLGVTEAVIAGGTSAVSGSVASEVASLGAAVVRKAGGTRYGTAAEVSAYAVQRGWLDDVFAGVATGRSYADALGGGVSAGRKGGVLLLTDPANLSPETRAFILGHGDLGAVAIFGGTSAVSDAVLGQVAALL